MKALSVTLMVLILEATLVSAQRRDEPRKFDEFINEIQTTSYPYAEVTSKTHIDRFLMELKRRKGGKAYIVFYQGRQINDGSSYEMKNLAEQTKWKAVDVPGWGDENILIIDGGFREKASLEFWIGTRNSVPPTLKPTVAEDEVFQCPSFSIYQNGFSFDKANPVVFNAYINERYAPQFKWTVSTGKIISGEKTKSIQVDVSGTSATTVTANLELDGLPFLCKDKDSLTIKLGRFPFLFDVTERYLYSDLHARIDGYMIALNNNPELTGYIIGYAGRGSGRVEIDRALASVTQIFRFRRYFSDRVKLINGGYREFNTVEMWLVPPGAEPPKATPTVDPAFMRVLRRKTDLGEH